MNEEARIRQLLDELMTSRTTPEEVCADFPQLLRVVRRRWGQIRRLEAELDVLFPSNIGHRRVSRTCRRFLGPQAATSRGMFAEALGDAAVDIAKALAECLAREPQDLGGLELIGVGVLQDGREEDTIDLKLSLGVQIPGSRSKALADEFAEGTPAFTRPVGGLGGGQLGQECGDKHTPARVQQRLLHDTLQFADVAWPRVTTEPVHRFRGDLSHVPSQFPAEATQVIIHKHRQVLATFTQRRQADREDAQSIVQIGPELSLLGKCFQITIRSYDDADICLDGFVPADSFESLILEQPKDFPLRGQRHVANLIQEDRAAVALLKLADAAAIGAGEGALLVPE
jgi:hypothetical protein